MMSMENSNGTLFMKGAVAVLKLLYY